MSATLDRLEAFLEGQVLRRADVHVAQTLARLGHEDAPDVVLAAALAARAPRHGHVCVELDRVTTQIEPQAEEGQDPAALDWPALDGWLDALRASPLVRGPRSDRVTPLVLDGARLYLDRYWGYQARLLARLRARIASPAPEVDVSRLREGLATSFPPGEAGGLDRQRLGAAMAVLRRFTVISGGPGTGKTTTITRILALLLDQARACGESLRVALAAPTGKAANRVKESIESELARLTLEAGVHDDLARAPSFTLHRLLGYRPDNPTRFRHDRERPLPYDVVVVDEASMVSFAMMAKLVDAVPDEARLILLGDHDQLASVEAGAVLGDMSNPHGGELRFSRAFAGRVHEVADLDLAAHATLVDEPGIWDGMVQLDRFYRFGERSGIGGVARAIQRGESERALAFLRGEATEAEDDQPYSDVELVEVGDDGGALPPRCKAAIVGGYRRFVEVALASQTGEDALDALDGLRVLCAHRRGPLGVETLNPTIESWLAAEVEGFAPDRTWYTGRPVIVTENDYGLRLFNGDTGVVIEIEGRHVVVFRQQGGGVRRLSPARLPPCETVFAMSIHKSQGSQFGHALVVLPGESSRIVTRELVYTGVTRARERATVVARAGVLTEAVETPVRRASGLRDALWPGVEAEGPGPGSGGGSGETAPRAREPAPRKKVRQLDLFLD